MNSIKFSQKPVGLLVELRAASGSYTMKRYKDVLWCTISPNPSVKHKVYKRKSQSLIMIETAVRYDMLTHKQQYEYCLKVLKDSYIPFLTTDAEIYGSWELNKSKNVHLHFIIMDKQFLSDRLFECFRREVSCCFEPTRNLTKVKGNQRKAPVDFMNSIVRLNDSILERCHYMDKDYEEDDSQLLNYYYSKENLGPTAPETVPKQDLVIIHHDDLPRELKHKKKYVPVTDYLNSLSWD